ncbi:MAG: lipase maturation factor family protein, partial [Candidatus Binatia bacterium]
VYLAAFVSLGVQIPGLVGSQGILPAGEFLDFVRHRLGAEALWRLPTLAWIASGDAFLQGMCWAGAGLSVLLIFGYAPSLLVFILWLLYLSLFSVGQVFLGYQWDILLLETGFLAVWAAPLSLRWRGLRHSAPHFLIVLLFWWLLFRLLLQSSLVKWLSGDPSWRDLSAVAYHYESQPLPNWIGFYFYQLPRWFHKFSAAAVFFIEGALPFLIFTPRVIRRWVALAIIAFQILIMLTGNYGFFNWLSIAIALWLFEDGDWRAMFRRRVPSDSERPQALSWPRPVLGAVFLLILSLSIYPLLARSPLARHVPSDLRHYDGIFSSFHLVNGYGLFAVMTKGRGEIAVEG